MAYQGDVASAVFKDPTRIKQLVAAGYRVLLMGAYLDRFATRPIAVMPFGKEFAIPGPKKLYFIFAPPVVGTGSWDRHVDVYLNDIMNVPAPRYEQEPTTDSKWLPMKVDFADGWEGAMLDHTHLSETHEGIPLEHTITEHVFAKGPPGPIGGPKSGYCYGMMDENGALNGPVIPKLVGLVTGSATQAMAISDKVIMLSENKDRFGRRCLLVHI